MAIFSPKNINYLKNTLLSYNFFQIFHEPPPPPPPTPPRCHTHIWLKKRQSCQNYTIFWANEDNRISFFPLFNEKIFALMSIFCKKNVYSLIKTLLSCTYFYRKNVHPLKTRCSHVFDYIFS